MLLIAVKKEPSAEEVIQALNQQISEYKKYLARNSRNTYLGKKASYSLQILAKELFDIQEMKRAISQPLIPCSISIDIISNGTTHLKPCIAIHTNYKDYLFNCPEGTSRFLAANRLKPSNLADLFFTRGSAIFSFISFDTWNHFAGVPGLLKTPISVPLKTNRVIRLHGSHNKAKYLECQNEHADADVPLTVAAKLDIAFLVELKPPLRSLDIEKIKKLKIPGGPHMKQLKDGINITLSDGRFIMAEDVLSEKKIEPQHACLVVECSEVDKLPSLRNSTLLQDYIDGQKIMRYIVHFTEDPVLLTDEYKEWMASFGETVEHIIVNGSGPCLPHMDSIYRINAILNYVSPKLFPLIHPQGFNGTVMQDDECERKNNYLYARPFQRFYLRKPSTLDPVPPHISLNLTDSLLRLKEDSQISEAINLFVHQSNMVREVDTLPRICFLGTSSAVPTSFRNVSAYFLQFSDDSSIMVDCGEGSYGQLRILFGDRVCEELLLKLSVVFITHGHQDHFQGLFTIMESRKLLFKKKGMDYIPLVVVAGSYVLKIFREISHTFGNYARDMHIVNISKLIWEQSQKQDNPVEAVDLTQELNSQITSVEHCGLKSVIAVKVNHSKNPVGYIFTDLQNRKFVFSGDTMPCDNLVKYGQDALVLVHESTFADDEEAHALYKRHSTMKQAYNIATRMGARNLILTHFSAKYPKVPPLPDYIEQAGNVTIAMDNMIVTPSDLEISAKLIPVLRAVFSKEMTVINERSLKRHIQEEFLSKTSVDTFEDTVNKSKKVLSEKYVPFIVKRIMQNGDVKRPNRVVRYKPVDPHSSLALTDDPLPDYMNVLGMVFSMCGLMMRKYYFIPKTRLSLIAIPYFIALEAFDCFISISALLKMKWCAWVALLCSCVSFANTRTNDDTKQIVSSFMLSISAVVMSYLQNPLPIVPPWASLF
ncbi:unnamed protein product [Thelazia callipaeda]|uniref:ribonuclease Z n=1 Tax=Thelazia callipaeda TaxID=103827 RepID=A0A0N5CWR0_THECL|nr:unnamed protein product [Thelazia callipaeda]